MKAPSFNDLILFENEQVVVVNKPPHLSSLDERFTEKTSLLKLARSYNPELRLCHRLDKETSGVLVLAKDDDTYRTIAMEFEHRRVLKRYHAIVDGIHKFENLEVDLPIGTARNGLMRIDFSEGKDALTYFSSVKYFRHYTLVECTPITGRTHQIRVHLASQKATIAGDLAYGGKEPFLSRLKRKFKISEFEEERPMISRFALHARQIKFNLNESTEINVEAPYPKDIQVFVKQLEKYDN